jgi:uncharacterized protein YjiS (DUF1127 family)
MEHDMPYHTAAFSLAALRNAGSRFIVQRKIRIALARLDDHMLKDLGLARADIERLSRGTVADLISDGRARP